MTPVNEELTPWEKAFLADPGEPRGYQPLGGPGVPEEPPEPPTGPAGASSSDRSGRPRSDNSSTDHGS